LTKFQTKKSPCLRNLKAQKEVLTLVLNSLGHWPKNFN
jgi:hypothetical protein